MSASLLTDTLGRPLRNLRLSVTDRCNLRCQYCMPEEDYVWLPRDDLLHFEEISRLVDVFTGIGVDGLRLTGGEPLLRRDLPALVRMLVAKPAVRDLAMTTNGMLLAEQAKALFEAGLHRITVSLDTLREDRFRSLTRRDGLDQVRAGLDAARAAGFTRIKLDTVVMRGVNDDELLPMVQYGKSLGAEVRFIEYMDVGGATRWSIDQVVTRGEIVDSLGRSYGGVTELREESSAPADRFVLADGTVFGVISSTTAPFCRSCDRSRLTADGMWYLCLYAKVGINLRAAVRAGASSDEIRSLLMRGWETRTNRGAEDRLAQGERGRLMAATDLRRNPHLEMHTRGG